MLIGILFGLALLMYLSMRGWSMLISGPLCAIVVALTSKMDLLESLTDTYMGGTADFFKSWFIIFLLGALFGKVMEESGAAESLAKGTIKVIGNDKAILATIIATSLLTYGGVSLFVVVFTIYPLAVAMFKESNLPKRLIPGCIGLGAFSFTAIAIPGSPQLQNLLPRDYFGTTTMAAPVIGIICAAFIFIAGTYYMMHRAKEAIAAGEVFVAGEADLRYLESNTEKELPNAWASIIPLLIIIVFLNVFKLHVIIALISGVLAGAILFFKHIKSIKNIINTGAKNSMLAILNTSFAVGFGTIVKVAPGFTQLVNGLDKIAFGNTLIFETISINALAGITGSASGGLGIALEVLADKLMASGINPEVLHRVASISANGLDSLPQCGAVLTLLTVCGLTHRDSYKDIFVTTVIINILAAVLAIILGSMGIV